MSSIFGKQESDAELLSRIHVQAQEALSNLGANLALAKAHKDLLDGDQPEDKCNMLIMVAYRNLFLAAGIAKHRVMRETLDEKLAERAATTMLNDSGLRKIVKIVRETLPITIAEPMLAVTKEAGILFRSATLIDRLLRQNDTHRARQAWVACVHGDYSQIPLIYAGHGNGDA